MFRWALICLIVFAVGAPSVHAGNEPLRVVFVGNSYTYTNDLPMLFRSVVRSQHPERDVETEAFVTPGGYLNERWREGVVQRHLKSNRVDVLVLQEAGGWLRCADHPSLRSTFACTDSLRTHKRFAELAAKLGIRTVILGTWGGDVREQTAISRVTRRLSKAIGAVPADAGEAIVELRRIDDKAEIFTDRFLHPSMESSVLAAVMLYAAIDGWLPKPKALTLNQPVIAMVARPDPKLPLSAQYAKLPKVKVGGISAERMKILVRAAEKALSDNAL